MPGMTLTLAELLEDMADAGRHAGIEVSGLALDSRNVAAGDAFVALKGQTGHGLDHVGQAAERGAVVVLHDEDDVAERTGSMPALRVPGLVGQLAGLAQRMWNDPAAGLDLVAVTGTNGKTSVAWLLAQALDGAMIGTLGAGRPGAHTTSTLTTPDLLSVYRTLAQLREAGVGRVVMEASSHALAQGRLAGLSFTTAIFTMLGHDHLDYHADRADYAEAKARLLTEFDSRRQLINLDDDFGAALARRLASSPGLYGYSLSGAGRAHAQLLDSGGDGLHARITADGQEFEVRSRLLGRINLWNVLIVAAELVARGWGPGRVVETIAGLEPVPGRMQPIRDAAGRLAIIDYAHTPDALRSALVSVRELAEQDLWCVFGCGGDRDQAKRPRMGRIAESLADHVVLTDDNPRGEDGVAIIRAIQSGMERPDRSLVIRDRARAIRHAIESCIQGDVVLVAGKGHETEQVIGGRRLPFDDACIAREALGVAA